MSMLDQERLAQLQSQLMELRDDGLRGRVHLELGRFWVRWDRLELAARHFQEALLLDPQLQDARLQLTRLRSLVPAPASEATRRGRVRSFAKRIYRRGSTSTPTETDGPA